ncbi:hypothetical protein QYF36_015944 [Acer negundo]|nr:hypothetical protein QYF36_015944 [Acer negundo]
MTWSGSYEEEKWLTKTPLEAQLSCKVDVKIGFVSFLVKLVEHQVSANIEWVNKVLGLKQWANLNEDADKEVFDKESPFSGKEESYDGDCRHDRGRAGGRVKGEGKSNDRMGYRKDVIEFSSSSKMARKEVGSDRRVLDKGKGRWIQRQKPTFKQLGEGGAVKIDKKRIYSSESSPEDFGSSDFKSNFEDGPVKKTNSTWVNAPKESYREEVRKWA